MSRHYFCMPFHPLVGQKESSSEQIAKLLGDTINKAAEQGWMFQSYENVPVHIKGGCLTFGAASSVVNHAILVFYQDHAS